MPENLTSARFGGGYLFSGRDGLTCNGCGESFEKPVLATIVSSGSSTTYYACPRCLTKVEDVKPVKHDKGGKEETTSTVVVSRSGESVSERVKCEHFFGYLRNRPKNTPIPDECLTCDKMIECLTC
ncbi:MAG: hypothetical protein QXZ47_02160 [Candidatus Bathyarchaeia archaeon]